jgi:hypothetical protein
MRNGTIGLDYLPKVRSQHTAPCLFGQPPAPNECFPPPSFAGILATALVMGANVPFTIGVGEELPPEIGQDVQTGAKETPGMIIPILIPATPFTCQKCNVGLARKIICALVGTSTILRPNSRRGNPYGKEKGQRERGCRRYSCGDG